MAGRTDRNIRLSVYLDDKTGGFTLKQLKAEAAKLRNEIALLPRGTEEYINKAKRLKEVQSGINQINKDMRVQQGLWGRLADGANKFQALAVGVIGATAGLVLGFKNMVQKSAELSDSIADVQKTTGMTKDEVVDMMKSFQSIDTRSSRKELLELARIAGKLGIEGTGDIQQFVRAADQIKVALSEDLGGDVEESVRQIGKLTDVFRLTTDRGMNLEESMLKTGSAINALGASSTANEEFLVEFGKRMGGIAPLAKISIEDTLGLGAALDQLGQTAEVSSTAFMKLIPEMFKDTASFAEIAGMKTEDFANLLSTDANEAILKFVEGLKGNNEGMSELAKRLDGLGIDGARAVGVLGVLANNIDIVRQQQQLANDEFEKGTSLTEEFNTKNENMAAKLAKVGKAFYSLFVSSKLMNWLENAVDGMSKFLGWIEKNINAIKIMGKVLISLISGLTAYKLTLFVINNYQRVGNALIFAWQKVALLTAFAYNKLTGNITRAAAAQRALNIATKGTGWGLLASLIATATTAYFTFRNRVKEATAEQNKLNESIQKGQDILMNSKDIEERYRLLKKLSKTQVDTLISDAEIELSNLDDVRVKMDSHYLKLVEKDLEWNNLQKELAAETNGFKKLQIQQEIEARELYYQNLVQKEFKMTTSEWQQSKERLEIVKKEAEARAKILTPVVPGEPPGSPDAPQGGGKSTEELLKTAEEDYEEHFSNLLKQTQKFIDDKNNLELKQISDMEKWLKETEEKEQEADRERAENEDKKKEEDAEKAAKDAADAINREQEMWEKRLQIADQFTSAISNLVYSAKEFELSKIKEVEQRQEESDEDFLKRQEAVEEEKKAIQKKYADIEFAITTARIVIDTASAIMKAVAQLGPVGGAIAGTIIGAAGLAQIAVANEQRKIVQGLFTGGYTGDGDPTQEAGVFATGQPFHKQEYVIPSFVRDHPYVRSVEPVLESIRQRRLSGYAEGGETNNTGFVGQKAKAFGEWKSNTFNSTEVALLVEIRDAVKELKYVKAVIDQEGVIDLTDAQDKNTSTKAGASF
jgi:TP901 family phage tail tape measure protein